MNVISRTTRAFTMLMFCISLLLNVATIYVICCTRITNCAMLSYRCQCSFFFMAISCFSFIHSCYLSFFYSSCFFLTMASSSLLPPLFYPELPTLFPPLNANKKNCHVFDEDVSAAVAQLSSKMALAMLLFELLQNNRCG